MHAMQEDAQLAKRAAQGMAWAAEMRDAASRMGLGPAEDAEADGSA